MPPPAAAYFFAQPVYPMTCRPRRRANFECRCIIGQGPSDRLGRPRVTLPLLIPAICRPSIPQHQSSNLDSSLYHPLRHRGCPPHRLAFALDGLPRLGLHIAPLSFRFNRPQFIRRNHVPPSPIVSRCLHRHFPCSSSRQLASSKSSAFESTRLCHHLPPYRSGPGSMCSDCRSRPSCSERLLLPVRLPSTHQRRQYQHLRSNMRRC